MTKNNNINSINTPTPITVTNGGTGDTSFTAYTILCGGTTSTGALQHVANVGNSSQYLISNGASALPSFQMGGVVTQCVTTVLNTTFITSSATYTALTGLSVSITPTYSTSNVLVFGSITGIGQASGTAFQIYNGTTGIGIGSSPGSRVACTTGNGSNDFGYDNDTVRFAWVDSPATTSSITYSIQMAVQGESGQINYTVNDPNSSSGFRGICTIFAMELA